ncbi:uncharacterized protein LOC131247178 [Magnolia sinica]|uniref:uncharacterized protein LOC131247178 n=1 Tax=Magnolia sinica TaxID=86752 RepID=UPI00265873C6|nr:uncharacterized protein LOC131247178 [Magnolia sinica]
MDFHLLEINLISAQSLKKPASPLHIHRMQTYAVAWVDPTTKLRTRVDLVGAENPTWNDKFIFRVPASFLDPFSSSAFCLEIYAVGRILDTLIGTVRCLVGGLRLCPSVATPSFAALQIRRPSGSFHGIVNLGATLLPPSFHALMGGIAAIGFHDLMGQNPRDRLNRHGASAPCKKERSSECSWRGSDGSDSKKVLKELNGVRNRSDGGGILRRLGFQRRIHLSPSDQDLQISLPSDDK